jgi:hypothetical protein
MNATIDSVSKPQNYGQQNLDIQHKGVANGELSRYLSTYKATI